MKTRPAPSARKSKAASKGSPKPKPAPATPAQPAFTGRTVLLAVTGMSPAILTETVWALAQENPPVVPDEVIVVTTTKGAADLRRDLLAPREDWGGLHVWEALRKTILGGDTGDAPRLQLAVPRVIELPDRKSGVKAPAADLRTPGDNTAAADFLLEEVRRFAENPDTRIIASIAGGRKTMGALLYACMSLLGRETDRLTHVLVNEPFETCRGFFFPSQPVRNLAARVDGNDVPVTAADARIELANIPFVALRNLFERDLVKKPGTFAALVERCSHRVAELARQEVSLLIRTDRPEIVITGTPVSVSTAEYVLLRHLAEAAKAGKPPIDGYDAAASAVTATAQRIYAEHDANDFSDWRFKALPPGEDGWEAINERWITKHLNSLKTKLDRAGTAAAAIKPLLPVKRRFSLDLPPDRITIED